MSTNTICGQASAIMVALSHCCTNLILPRFSPAKTQALEFSQYLEHYLWPNFSPEQVGVNLSPWEP